MRKESGTNVSHSSLYHRPIQPDTLLLCWQPLLWREPGTECGVAVAKHTEQDGGVL